MNEEGKTKVTELEEYNSFQGTPKSSVKLKNTTRGLSWEIKIVTGEEDLIDGLMKKAVKVHNELKKEFGDKDDRS